MSLLRSNSLSRSSNFLSNKNLTSDEVAGMKFSVNIIWYHANTCFWHEKGNQCLQTSSNVFDLWHLFADFDKSLVICNTYIDTSINGGSLFDENTRVTFGVLWCIGYDKKMNKLLCGATCHRNQQPQSNEYRH